MSYGMIVGGYPWYQRACAGVGGDGGDGGRGRGMASLCEGPAPGRDRTVNPPSYSGCTWTLVGGTFPGPGAGLQFETLVI